MTARVAHTRTACSMLALLVSIGLNLYAQASPAAQPGTRVQAGSLVRPDTVEVGDRFTFVVTVAVPEGSRVEWGAITDTSSWVAQMGAAKVTDEGTKLGIHKERAEYTLTAWNVGEQKLGVPDATVRNGANVTRIPLADARVYVRSVLPADTSLHVPKPARDLFQREVPWWQRWWPALLVIAALALLWWYLQRRRKQPRQVAVTPPLSPYQRAMHDFERLERLKLADAGECGRYVALATDVMRNYLADRVPNAVLSLTSAELLLVALEDDRVPRDRLISLLADADGVKFAARTVTPERARELATDARGIVTEVERVDTVRRATEEAARQAAEQAAARAKASDEDRARKASRQPKSDSKGGGPKAGAR